MLQPPCVIPRILSRSLKSVATRSSSPLLRLQWLEVHKPSRSCTTTVKAGDQIDASPGTMSKSSHRPPVLIIGAGLAGLSLAVILHKNEIPYLVFESSPPTPSKGHGVTLHPWAYLPLCKALCIAAEELRSAVAVDSELGGFGAVDFTVRDVHTGGALPSEPSTLEPEASDVAEPFRANKRVMQRFLLERIGSTKVFWGWTLKSSRNGDSSVTAEFENGETIEGRLLVAADGLHSVGMTAAIRASHRDKKAKP